MFGPEIMIKLLRKMAEADDGSVSLIVPRTFDSCPKQYHHFDLLRILLR